jgi:hypothetical protein
MGISSRVVLSGGYFNQRRNRATALPVGDLRSPEIVVETDDVILTDIFP